jgi:hypothetical protein
MPEGFRRKAAPGRIFSHCTRYFPLDAMRSGAHFVTEELKHEGWLKASVCMEFWSYRPPRPNA